MAGVIVISALMGVPSAQAGVLGVVLSISDAAELFSPYDSSQSVGPSVGRSVVPLVRRSVNQSISQSANQSISQSANRSISQSVGQ